MSVTEYRDRFLQLARYAPADVADDRKKQEHFMEGLEDYLQYALLNLRFDDFNHLVDSALNTERKHLEMEDKKRKIVPVASGSSYRTAGSGTSSHLLSLRPAGALRQRLPPEGAGGTAGAPSSAQGASTRQGEPRDGRVSGRGS